VLTCDAYAVSGQSFDADKRRAVEAGADGYFVKPLSLRTLDDLIALHFPAPSP
jgi:DNA-binding response OmpR family regulator